MAENSPHILAVGAAATTSTVRDVLAGSGWQVVTVASEEQAHNALRSGSFDALLTSLEAPHLDGIRLLTIALEVQPDICAVALGEAPEIEVATEVMRLGAYDFLIFPQNRAKLQAVLERGLEHRRLRDQQALLRRRLHNEYNLANLVGNSRIMTKAHEAIRRATTTDAPVVLLGEYGTGKDFAAQTIHTQGTRHEGAYVSISSNEFAPGELLVELFGHRSGEQDGRIGRLERAQGGTLHIRNAETLSPEASAALQHYLESGEALRVGDTSPYVPDTRLILSVDPPVADSAPLATVLRLLEQKSDVVFVSLPPLRERLEDLPELVRHLLAVIAHETDRPQRSVEPELLDILQRHDWPDNIRGLRNALVDAAAKDNTDQAITYADLPAALRGDLSPTPGEIRVPPHTPLRVVERMVIEEAMKTHGGRKEDVAKTLQIGLRTLYRKLDQYQQDTT